VPAIGSQPARVAIMQNDYFSAAAGLGHCTRCRGQSPFGDATEAFDQARRGLRLPVVTSERPHGHAAQTRAANGAPKLGTAISEGRAHQYRRRVAFESKGTQNAVLAGAEFVRDSPRRQECQVHVRFGVITDAVPAIGDLAHQFRASAGEPSDQEKTCGRPVAFQEAQELGSVCRIWPVVESERDLGRIRSMVPGGTKKL
jgi:hypothetical protein